MDIKFPALGPQRASIGRKAFSDSLRAKLFEACVPFPEGGRPLFAGGSADDLEKKMEIKDKRACNPVTQRKTKSSLGWGVRNKE